MTSASNTLIRLLDKCLEVYPEQQRSLSDNARPVVTLAVSRPVIQERSPAQPTAAIVRLGGAGVNGRGRWARQALGAG